MKQTYKEHLNWSKSNRKEVDKSFKRLRSKKNPDGIVGDLHDQAFEEINCLECANCCKTTGPLLTNRDIARVSKHLKMKEAAFITQYVRIDEEGDYVFKSMPCPFLDKDNYCSIYSHRPKACREFPHTDQKGQLDILHLTRKNARICPAVSLIVQKLKAVT